MAFHMIHMGDSRWPDGGPSRLAPPGDRLGASVAGRKSPTKVLEAPLAYSLPFANETNVTRRAFLGMVRLVDEAIGNLTRAWERTGHGANGVIVVTSDNGSPWDARGSDGNLPLRGEKHMLFDGGMKAADMLESVRCTRP